VQQHCNSEKIQKLTFTVLGLLGLLRWRQQAPLKHCNYWWLYVLSQRTWVGGF